MPRSTQISSMHSATFGKISDTSIPDWPCFLKANGDISKPPVRRSVLTSEEGGRWPLYLVSAGFGSNVSTCDGPPFMNRWITRFALPGKCGCRGAKGDRCGDAVRAPSEASRFIRPREPKPKPQRVSISRRVRNEGRFDDMFMV